jgi:3-oxoacyl-[acyl-carrier protein] reductase
MTALVTGGTRGIGKATALALARRGAAVAVAFRSDRDAALAAAREIESLSVPSLAIQADVRSSSDCERMVREAESLGPVEALVCCAGIARDTLLGASEPADFDAVLEVNLSGTVNVCRAVARGMLARRRGAIVTISSVAAQRPGRGQSNYAASKGAVEAFTRALAVELAPRNIRVNCVAPGIVETRMTEEIRALAGEEVNRRILLRRPGTPAEVGAIAALLCSDEASYVTGQVWNVDGGFKLE